LDDIISNQPNNLKVSKSEDEFIIDQKLLGCTGGSKLTPLQGVLPKRIEKLERV